MQNVIYSDQLLGEQLPPLEEPVTATSVISGAIATRDWRPMHHDRDFAQQRNNVRDIFFNTPTLQAWLERYITDWAGPYARLGRLKVRMSQSIFPGDVMTIGGEVVAASVDNNDCGWLELALTICVNKHCVTSGRAQLAVPVRQDDNPWLRSAAEWRPPLFS